MITNNGQLLVCVALHYAISLMYFTPGSPRQRQGRTGTNTPAGAGNRGVCVKLSSS